MARAAIAAIILLLVGHLTVEILVRLQNHKIPTEAIAAHGEDGLLCTGALYWDLRDEDNLPHYTFSYRPDSCPPQHVMMAVTNFSSSLPKHAGNAAVIGLCCKLPVDDALVTGESIEIGNEGLRVVDAPGAAEHGASEQTVDSSRGSGAQAAVCPEEDIVTGDDGARMCGVTPGLCPTNYVVTGGSGDQSCGSYCTIHCTKINTAKYALVPAESLFWELDDGTLHYGRGARYDVVPLTGQVWWHELPPSFRAGVGRAYNGPTATVNTVGGDGCIGNPPGSVLVGRTHGTCDGFKFASLVRKGEKEPLVKFRSCDAIEGINTGTPRCINFTKPQQ